ncbi:putative heat shock protein-like protein [Trypanosoma grayi]|uniref:putative heat shock protein-like protein n=1 Tax=Trypanosoma grayi TaxID=71804 RepID=UPI0004F43D3C|nr:putative heat shock protein-like protein [Trypanosoma grayi]KEG07297.1 putative heat shock protein-like protein [Trypanosoma grayi]
MRAGLLPKWRRAPCRMRHSSLVGGGFCVARRCYGPSKEGGQGVGVPLSTVELPDMLDMDEAMTINVYRPHSEEEAPLQEATRRFLCVLITTPAEQEWRDMLSAAIRHNTWREHHVRAVLRSVHGTQYEDGSARALCGLSKCPTSTPGMRLERAVGVVQTGVDEGYRAESESVHALLVVLLRASLPDPAAGATGANTKTPPLTTRAAVWQFLAWMERHDYHVLSDATLRALEHVAEDDALGATSQQLASSVRQNRLEYLRSEHDRLCQGDTATRRSQRRVGRVLPVAEPDDGSV